MYAVVTPVLRLPSTLPNTFDYSIPETLAPFVRRGSLVAIPWRKRIISGIVWSVSSQTEMPPAKIKQIVGLGPRESIPQEVLQVLEDATVSLATHLGTILNMFIPDIPKRAIAKEVSVPENAIAPLPYMFEHAARHSQGIMTAGFTQHLALLTRILAKAHQDSRSVLILTPHRREVEVLAGALASIIPAPIVVLDPLVSAGKRYRSFCAALAGATLPVVYIGTRSAVLHPDPHIAEIVVLECESRDHRNVDGAPHFDAREFAKKRAQFSSTGCIATLVGVAPRAEDGAIFLETPVEISREFSLAEEPPTLVDIATTKYDLIAGVLSEYAAQAIGNALQAGRSVLLLHNRKGASLGLFCKSCREVFRCVRCKAVIRPDAGLCGRCGFTIAANPKSCSKCGNMLLESFGHGTRRVAEELQKVYPNAHIVVLDSDSPTKDGHLSDTALREDADILVGTTLALHDALYLPHILPRLGVIVSTTIDAMLAEPDMRAMERAWQELKKMTTLASQQRAEVVIQTIAPEHELFAKLPFGLSFLQQELQARERLVYPPFGKLVLLSSKIPAAIHLVAKQLRAVLPEYELTHGVRSLLLIGPLPTQFDTSRLILKTPELTDDLVRFLRSLPEDVRVDTEPDVSS